LSSQSSGLGPNTATPLPADRGLRRLLCLFGECSQRRTAALHADALCAAICEALTEIGGYALACVGTPTREGFELLTASVATGSRVPENWEAISQFGGEALSLPLYGAPYDFGVLKVIASDQAGFAVDERQVLEHIADDLAGGVSALRATSAHRQMESQLRQLSRALESSSNGVMITCTTQLDHPIVYVNPAFERITGYSADEVIGRSGRFLVRDDLNQKGLNEIRNALRGHRDGHAVLRNYRKDGQLFWNELNIAPVRDEDGGMTTHFVSIINDVTARITYEQQLEYHATHDGLTGLANRSLLNDRIDQAIARARHGQRLVGVLLLDLDRFKLINDGFGHLPADNLLRAVSERLSSCVRDTDTVARLGGDEFVVVVTDIEDADDVAIVGAKILRTLAQPLTVEEKEVFVTASIGIAMYPRDGEHGESLLRNADMAMYRVKEHGRNNYRFYAPEMSHMALDRLDMEGNLRRALERDELLVYYQPILSLSTGQVVGAEALLRWNHPRIGMIQPPEFIPLAEETGLIIQLGDLVLHQVCQQIRSWQEAGLPDLRVAINISARQFRQENLAEHVCHVLEKIGIKGSSLEFELTESMVMHDMENTLVTLRELKALGASLSLDDFGTGYSSLSYLKRFPIDTLKIDRSFVRDINADSDDAAIAHAVIAMAHSLGLQVIAEGVEDEAQLELLRGYQCDRFQGYLFSRPVPAEEFTLILQSGKRLKLAGEPEP